MRNDTRRQYNAYLSRLQELNGVDDATVTFSTEPSIQQTLESKIQESSEFLGRINIIGRDELAGEKIGLGISGPAAGTTDTAVQAREPSNLVSLDNQGYFCTKTNFDTFITYAQLDAWAKFKDFQIRVASATQRQQALDRITIGFNGVSRAATSNKSLNPLLQDVNKGWLQKYREFAPARVLNEVESDSGKIKVGATATAANGYKNLDAVVFDATNNMIEPWYQENPDLVVICGRKLLADKYFPIINKVQDNSETLSADVIISQKRIGNLPAVRVPFFPANSLMITSLKNLSIYWQIGGRRRHIKEEADRDRIVNFESSNEAYVVEDYGFGCLVENIELVD